MFDLDEPTVGCRGDAVRLAMMVAGDPTLRHAKARLEAWTQKSPPPGHGRARAGKVAIVVDHNEDDD
jgi:hypothetical protein